MSNSADEYDGAMIVFASYWTITGSAFAPGRHNMKSPEVTHACEYETSMMLTAHEELVHLEDAKAGPPVIDSPFYHSERGGRVSLASRFHRLTTTGAMGQPELATREKGESLITAAAEEVAAFIEDFLTWTQPKVLKK
ncbi:MAG: creatininase family protein [Pirellulales bacterium]